jgi:hypothetical protein
MAGMGQKVWVAILGFAVFLFSALGVFVVYLWTTHQMSNSEGWGGLGMSTFTISSSYRALQQRLKYNADHPRHPTKSNDLPHNLP